MSAIDMTANLNLNDNGYSEGVKSAQKILNSLNQEFGISERRITPLNKQVVNARKAFIDLSASYEQLDDAAKNSDFGRAFAEQVEQAKKKANELIELQGRIKENLSGGVGGNLNIPNIGFDPKGVKDGVKSLVGGITSELGALGSTITTTLTNPYVAAGTAIATFTTMAVNSSKNYEKSISELSAITGVTGDDLDALSNDIRGLADDTNTSAIDVSKNFALVGSALPELLKDSKGLGEVSKSSITLAKAGLMPLESATSSLTDTMAQFNVKASDSSHVTDVLANASKLGSANIQSVAETLKRCGTAANQAGVSLEQTASLTEVLASKGLKGAEAGTALRNVFMKMSTSGIDAMNPKVVGLSSAMEYLKSKSEDAVWMTKTFGAENSTAASIIAQNIGFYNELSEGISNVGAAEEMARQNTDNLSGDLDVVKVKFTNLLSGFNVDDSPLRPIIQGVAEIIGVFDSLVHTITSSDLFGWISETAGVAIQEIVSILGNAMGVIGDLYDAVSKLLSNFTLAGSSFSALNVAMKAVGEVCFWVEAAIHAVNKAITYVSDAFKKFKTSVSSNIGKLPLFETIGNWIKSLISGIKKLIDWYKQLRGEVSKSMEEDGKSRNKSTKKEETNNSSASETNNSSTSGSTTTTTTTSKDNPLSKAKSDYEKRMREIYLQERAQMITSKKAEEMRVAEIENLMKAYVIADNATGKYNTRIKQLSSQVAQTKNSLKELEDNEKIINAEKEYADELEKAWNKRSQNAITETEYNTQLINSMKTLIGKYSDVGHMTEELRKKINQKKVEIGRIEYENFFKEQETAKKNYSMREAEIMSGYNYSEYYKNNNGVTPTVNSEISINASEVIKAIDRLLQSDFEKRRKMLEDSYILNASNETSAALYSNDEKANQIRSKYYEKIGKNPDDNLMSEKAQAEMNDSMRIAALEFRKVIEDGLKKIEDEFLKNAGVKSVSDLSDEQKSDLFEVKLRYENEINHNGEGEKNASLIAKEMYKSTVRPDGLTFTEAKELASLIANSVSSTTEKLNAIDQAYAQSVSDLNSEFKAKEKDLVDSLAKLLNVEVSYGGEEGESYSSAIAKIQVGIDAMNAQIADGTIDKNFENELIKILMQLGFKIDDIKNPENFGNVFNMKSLDTIKDEYASQGKKFKGSEENFANNFTPYSQIEKKYTPQTPKTKNELNTEELDQLMEKYRQLQEAANDAMTVGIKLDDSQLNQFDQLEAEIAQKSRQIQAHLDFEVTINGIEGVLDGVSSLASFGNQLATLGDQWEKASDAENSWAEGFQKTLIILQTASSIFEAINTVVEIFNALQAISAVRTVATAEAEGTKAAADATMSASSLESIGPKMAEAAANKTLEMTALDLAAAEIFAAHAEIPFAGVAIATGLTSEMIGTMAAIQASTLALTAFANGGVVDGKNGFSGDRNIIRVNGDEMVLTSGDQRNLYHMIESGDFGIGSGLVEFFISGTNLKGVLSNRDRKMSKVR